MAATLTACIVNLFATVLLVCGLHMGVVGAALGTVLAQAAAVGLLLCWRMADDGGATMRIGAAAPPPTRAEASAWLRFGLPLGVAQLTRVLNIAMVTAAASSAGVHACAAHQIGVSLFYLWCPFGDTASQAAQTFVPATSLAVRTRLIRHLLVLAAAAGMTTAALCLLPIRIPAILAIFTTDQQIIAATVGVLPLVGLCVLAYPLAAALEGVMIAERDGQFIARTYACMPAVTGGVIWGLGRLGLGAVDAAWVGFNAFQGARLVAYSGRRWQQRRQCGRDCACPSMTTLRHEC